MIAQAHLPAAGEERATFYSVDVLYSTLTPIMADITDTWQSPLAVCHQNEPIMDDGFL